MSASELNAIRAVIRAANLADEQAVLTDLLVDLASHSDFHEPITQSASDLVQALRDGGNPGLMEVFLAEYGLSTKEGVALMCLAEALLRVPDTDTIDALIEDKIAPSDWGAHMGHSSSPLVNASTWALMLTGSVLKENEGITGTLRSLVKRLGEPVIRKAVAQAMREMGRQFVLGQTIEAAKRRAKAQEARGYTYSYDMLGEAARTHADAERYFTAYEQAIATIATACDSHSIAENPGISVKLSALHPRYEATHAEYCVPLLVERTTALARQAARAGMGFNIDAEEADRLDLSLTIIEEVLHDPQLSGWDGFGVVVQAYGKRARPVIDWLYQLAGKLDRRIMVRLVKGAYWDTEIKRAQVLGLDNFPVFTRKVTTDVSYLSCAQKLLSYRDRIYPQFATHNAQTMAAIAHYATAGEVPNVCYEFQRLHGMGEALHDLMMQRHGTKSRIYAPVGAHEDLLAYLVRRLLENGANSSFVNQIVNEDVSVAEIASDPVEDVRNIESATNPNIALPPDLFGEERKNAKGWDVTDPLDVLAIEQATNQAAKRAAHADPLVSNFDGEREPSLDITSPARTGEAIGTVMQATQDHVQGALEAADGASADWSARPASERAAMLRKVADLYEEHFGRFFYLATKEAGKSWLDRVAELREAVDFLRYYADEAERLASGDRLDGRGVFVCISPWNFPLAIFTGQITAALAAGNTVIAKPAEQTPLIAYEAVKLFHKAGIPEDVLQFLPGEGATIGAALVSDARVAGVCFTGSTPTAQAINRAMAEHARPDAPLIAETGGLNAMIVDSSALPEQAVRDIVASAFQSAGQRCSALRMLYVQRDVADRLLTMLKGAMDALVVGDPADIATDVGPVIDSAAKAKIDSHIDKASREGRLLRQLKVPDTGTFVGPALISVGGIGDLEEEIFGPVLHVATYEAADLDAVIDAINGTGYGLTFGLHTRIDDRVQHVVDRVVCGNLYINRNQIGAIVGSQPFGGEGLSGTGPKAGGPNYLQRFVKPMADGPRTGVAGSEVTKECLAQAIANVPNATHSTRHQVDLPGPTGEANQYSSYPRGLVLCLGPGLDLARQQADRAGKMGCTTLIVAPGAEGEGMLDGVVMAETLTELNGFSAICFAGCETETRTYRHALANRPGEILPLLADGDTSVLKLERHVCIDTTAAGGNASLLAATG